MRPRVLTGLDVCLQSPSPLLEGQRLGVLMNQASMDSNWNYAFQSLSKRYPGQIRALFSPQHGFWGEQQANMIESPHDRFGPDHLPVYSLYSETRQPTPAMLDEIDCLVIDLQDVGTRVYTFVWTMLECLRACALHNVRIVILDRPNPLGGLVFEGPLLEADFCSFVGGSCIPLRHGLTLAELAQLLAAEEDISVDLHVVPMLGWNRSMLFPETGLPWIMPSPNMPRWETAVLYPGQVLLEGTQLSEGRGTTVPFEMVGAPWLNAERLLHDVGQRAHPGVVLRSIRFRPTFDKWTAETCEGLAIHIVDAAAVRSVALTVSIIAAAHQQAPERNLWLDPPYEYETQKPPIDILVGSPQLRQQLSQLSSPAAASLNNSDFQTNVLKPLVHLDTDLWMHRIAKHLLYA